MQKSKVVTELEKRYRDARKELMQQIRCLPSYGDECKCKPDEEWSIAMTDSQACIGGEFDCVQRFCLYCGGNLPTDVDIN